MFWVMGMQETYLQVDAENPSGALCLYENLGYEVGENSDCIQKANDMN